jgi:hypothetical protein
VQALPHFCWPVAEQAVLSAEKGRERALISSFWWLLVAHVLADYPLQGAFLARGKNHRNPIPGIP